MCAYVLMQCRMLQRLDVCLLCRVIQGGPEGQIVGIYPVSRTCAYYFCGFRAPEVGESLHACCEDPCLLRDVLVTWSHVA